MKIFIFFEDIHLDNATYKWPCLKIVRSYESLTETVCDVTQIVAEHDMLMHVVKFLKY